MDLIAFLYAKLFSGAATVTGVTESIYDFKVSDIEGNEVDFKTYRGKSLLIVNTASRCGYTPQYADLEKFHQLYGNTVTVLGFPANNFLWQEPGTDRDIFTFCQEKYNVTFKMFSKISVIGKHQHPLYQWLQVKTGKVPTWNFCKYLITNSGKDVKFYFSKVNPLDPLIVKEIRYKTQ